MKISNMNKLSLPLAISMALYGTHAIAEETEKKDDNTITVTAQKRVERLSEVPIAMSVFSEDKINQTGIQELRELGDFIPNMVVTQGTDFNSRIIIRGVGAASRNIGFDSRVGVYLDGVYLGQGPSVNQDLIDLEQVEVLRGPQGTLFGKNTVAGAVSLISEKPHFDELEGRVTAGFGNYNARETKLSVNIPFSDMVAAKIAMSSRVRDGFVKNIYTEGQLPTTINTVVGGVPVFGIPLPAPIETFTPPNTDNEYNSQDTQSYRAQLRIQPSENLDMNLAIDGLESARASILGIPITTTFGDTPYHYADASKFEINESFRNGETRDIFGVSLNIDYDLNDDYALRSITGYRDTEIYYSNDTDYSPIDFLWLYYKDVYEQKTQEFQLISPDDSDFKYVIGLYYYDQQATTIRNAVGGNAGWVFGVPVGGGAFNNGTVDTQSSAIFISGSYQIDEDWKLGFGGRFSRETKDVLWHLNGAASGSFGIGTTDPSGYNDSKTDNNFSPTISINYTMSPDTQVYAKRSTGFKSGGFNLDFITQPDIDAGISFDKETVDSYELGLKTSLLDDSLTLNIAYFNSNYEDYQVNQFFDLGDAADGTPLTSIRIENAAEVDTSGLELEANYRLTDNLTINGSVGFLDATFASYPDGANSTIVRPGGTLSRIPEDATGNDLPNAADFSAALGIEYYTSIDAIDMDLMFRLDMTHTGDYYTTINNETSRIVPGTHPLTFVFDLPHYQGAATTLDTVPFGQIKATTILNGRIGLLSMSNGLEVYIWGRNMTNEDENVDSFREFFGTLVNTPRTPRTYGIEFIYNF
ncbi:MAG: iron complex outermembrane receptor protein [Enterobacterales bacterium]|jgi:iron complex outermembrane receptor protein